MDRRWSRAWDISGADRHLADAFNTSRALALTFSEETNGRERASSCIRSAANGTALAASAAWICLPRYCAWKRR